MMTHPMETCDFLVVGGGVVGLSIARELKRRRPDASVLLIDKEDAPGRHASGRNSGVQPRTASAEAARNARLAIHKSSQIPSDASLACAQAPSELLQADPMIGNNR